MIVEHPNEILGLKCEDVQKDENVEELIERMINVLRESGGVGLAAPQVGSLKKIIIIDEHAETDMSSPRAMVNPRIVKSSTKTEYEVEQCLSIPGRKFRVERPKSVWVNYMNSSGKTHRVFVNGFEARIIQHEIDHLDGITILDRGEELK
jgi:peptide deformylase